MISVSHDLYPYADISCSRISRRPPSPRFLTYRPLSISATLKSTGRSQSLPWVWQLGRCSGPLSVIYTAAGLSLSLALSSRWCRPLVRQLQISMAVIWLLASFKDSALVQLRRLGWLSVCIWRRQAQTVQDTDWVLLNSQRSLLRL